MISQPSLDSCFKQRAWISITCVGNEFLTVVEAVASLLPELLNAMAARGDSWAGIAATAFCEARENTLTLKYMYIRRNPLYRTPLELGHLDKQDTYGFPNTPLAYVTPPEIWTPH